MAVNEIDETIIFTLDVCCGSERYRERTGHTQADRKNLLGRFTYSESFDVADQRVVGVWRWEVVGSGEVRRRKITRIQWRLEHGQLVEDPRRLTINGMSSVSRQWGKPRVCRVCGEAYPVRQWVRELRPLLDEIREQTPGQRTRRAAYQLFREWLVGQADSPQDALEALEQLERDTPAGQSVVARVCAELSAGAR